MKKLISKLWCFIHGHDFVKEPFNDMDNGQSKMGSFECVRCGYVHNWQYDYLRGVK